MALACWGLRACRRPYEAGPAPVTEHFPLFILGQHFSHKCFLILVQFVTCRAKSKECFSVMCSQGFFADSRTSGSEGFVKGQRGAKSIRERGGPGLRPGRAPPHRPEGEAWWRPGLLPDSSQPGQPLLGHLRHRLHTQPVPVPALPCSPVFVQASHPPESPALSLHQENCWAFKTPPGSPPSGLWLMP